LALNLSFFYLKNKIKRACSEQNSNATKFKKHWCCKKCHFVADTSSYHDAYDMINADGLCEECAGYCFNCNGEGYYEYCIGDQGYTTNCEECNPCPDDDNDRAYDAWKDAQMEDEVENNG
tara:strand:+ start:1046 stop:1405 length:360 start_codon:yes stop_codon:yes gene_type:complete